MKPIIDMHTHTTLSLCCHDEAASLQAYVDKAAEIGIQVLGITNHCWDERVPVEGDFYGIQNLPYNEKIWDEVPKDTKGVKLFVGIESEYCGMSDTLGITAEGAKKFEYVLVPHSHTHMRNFVIPQEPNYLKALDVVEGKLRAAFPEVSDRQIEKWMNMARFSDVSLFSEGPDLKFLSDFLCDSFVGLLQNEEFGRVCKAVPTFVAHPFCAVGYDLDQKSKMVDMISDKKLHEMFTLMAEMNVGYDISVNNFVREPGVYRESMFRVIAAAKDCGVKFTFGTDAHSIAALGNAFKSAVIYEKAGMTPDDLHPMYREFVTFD